MSIQGPSQRPDSKIFKYDAPQGESEKQSVFNSNPLYNGSNQYNEGEMPKSSRDVSHIKSPAVFSYAKAKETPEGRKAVAAMLEPGDVIVVRLGKPEVRDIFQKVNYWFQKHFRSAYTTEQVPIKKEDTDVSHIILVTHVDKDKGEVVVSEAVTTGTRTIDYFEQKNFALKEGVTHEIFRPNLPTSTQEINGIAIRAMKKQTYPKPSLTSEKAKENTAEKPGEAYEYSKLKAVRSLFITGFGKNANQDRIISKMLKQYQRFETDSRKEGVDVKKRTTFCSQMVSSTFQLGVFHTAVAELKNKDSKLGEAIAKFSDVNYVPTNKEYREFTKEFGSKIFEEMQRLCPQIKFSASNMSPTGFSALLRNTDLGSNVCNIKP